MPHRRVARGLQRRQHQLHGVALLLGRGGPVVDLADADDDGGALQIERDGGPLG